MFESRRKPDLHVESEYSLPDSPIPNSVGGSRIVQTFPSWNRVRALWSLRSWCWDAGKVGSGEVMDTNDIVDTSEVVDAKEGEHGQINAPNSEASVFLAK